MKKNLILPPTRFERLLDLTVIILLITSFTYIFIQWTAMPNPILLSLWSMMQMAMFHIGEIK